MQLNFRMYLPSSFMINYVTVLFSATIRFYDLKRYNQPFIIIKNLKRLFYKNQQRTEYEINELHTLLRFSDLEVA